MKKIILIFIYLFAFDLSSYAYTGAVSSATGGAGTGLVDLTESAFFNPATIPVYQRKQMAFSYSVNRFSVSLTDNGKEALFPASIAYEQTSNDLYKTKSYHLMSGYAYQTKKLGIFSIGTDLSLNEFKWLNLDTKYKLNKVSIGGFWQLDTSFSAGLTYKNKTLNDTELPDQIDQANSLNFGLAYIYQGFAQFRFDVEKIENQNTEALIYKIGLETFLNDWIITRFGYRNDNIHSMNFTTAGLGFAGPQFGLHYAYEVESKNTVDPLHVVDLSVPF